jgi:hypothetical protein
MQTGDLLGGHSETLLAVQSASARQGVAESVGA